MNRILDCPTCDGNEYHQSEAREFGKLRIRGTCSDCGWYDINYPQHPHLSDSGFINLYDLNDFRFNIDRDPLTTEEFIAIRTRTGGSLGDFANYLGYALVINRRSASRDP